MLPNLYIFQLTLLSDFHYVLFMHALKLIIFNSLIL